MKKSKGHPGERVRKAHVSFVQANFEQLAAESYKQYIEHGRGMLVLSDEEFVDKPSGMLIKYAMGYMIEGSDLYVAAGNKWPGKKEAGWVEDYDPKTTMLIAFSRSDGGISSYRVSGLGDGVPELAYMRSKGQRN